MKKTYHTCPNSQGHKPSLQDWQAATTHARLQKPHSQLTHEQAIVLDTLAKPSTGASTPRSFQLHQ